MENYRNELMQDQNFIRCSVLIAELLLKYKTKLTEDTENSGEPTGSPTSGFTYGHLIFAVSSFIIYASRKLLLTKPAIMQRVTCRRI